VAAAGGEVRRVGGGWGPIEELAWSPDGTRLAFVGHLMGDRGSDRTEHHVIVVDVEGGAPRVLTDGFEPSLGIWVRGDSRLGGTLPGLEWTESGIHFIASERGAAHLYRIEVAEPGARIRRIIDGPRTVSAFSVGADGGVAFVSETAVQPGDVYVWREGAAERRVTDANADLLRDVAISTPQHFTFAGTLGQAVDAWIMPPVRRDPGRRYPLVLETHRGAFGHGFFFEFQALAAAGYAVLFCNHVGAQGYGQAYARAQHGRWGGPDVDEMLRGLDAAAQFEFVDAARAGTMGLSAGGFYTNWLMAEPGRFKAGVSEAGIYNWLSKFGTSDIGFPYVIAENDGLPWDRRDAYWRMSPISRVDRITAPLLIIHADEDYRVDISESEQLFQALRYLGRPVEFLWFKGETHGFSRIGQPVNRIERLCRIIDWFARHL
jgi:dipeptidyl aminopeptidase/acylaminoacyl peptidase